MNIFTHIDWRAGHSYPTLMKRQAPGEELIDSLDNLRRHLNECRERLGSSGVERTRGLREAMGRDCNFHRKSLDLFLDRDYDDLKDLVASCYRLFQEVEGVRRKG